MNDMIKVVLVCAFSNANVRSHLPLDNRVLYNRIRRLFGLPTSTVGYGDVAGWNSYMIHVLGKREDIDLYVVSSHSGIKQRKVTFKLDDVHYCFVKSDIATMLKYIVPNPALWHRINPMRPIVKKYIKSVNPDIIALIGAENPHISGTVLGLDNYPLIVKCQTIYNNPDRKKVTGDFDEKNAYVERRIFDNLKYVSVSTKTHERLFRTMNKTAINFKWRLGNLLPEVKSLSKEYDFVNFAMNMIPSKGFPDAIKALAIVKQRYPHVKLNLTGGGSMEVRQQLVDLVNSLKLQDNVIFTPFFERQEDLFQHLQKSRFAVLPCKIDYVASTIRQAMHYELPVVCYETEGTITLNKDQECVLVAENSNIESLANKMLELLDDKQKAEMLCENAKEYATRWNDEESYSSQMVDMFNAVIDNYRFGKPVSDSLLYNTLEK